MPLVIAIDGPVSAGKSTVSEAVAKRLGILHLDTGAMYRAAGYFAINAGIDTLDEAAVNQLLPDMTIDVQYIDGSQRTFVNDEDVTEYIRTSDVGMAASNVSKWPLVRQKMVALQREIASKGSMLLDGRDIGTVVLPDATVKIFLTASVHERARRRYEEQLAKGGNESYEETLSSLKHRDEQDTTRQFDPLRIAPDAVVIDTTHHSMDETIEQVMRLIKAAT